MTVTEQLQWFDILQDQFGTPYFTDTEKLFFLNRGQYEYVKNLFPGNEGGIMNIEIDWNVIQNVSPLIWEVSEMAMNSSGVISDADVVTNLRSISGDATADIFYILGVEIRKGTSKQPAKILRHNDRSAFEGNYFKKPSNTNYRYLIQNNGYKFKPIDTTSRVAFTVIKTPVEMAISPAVECELPVSTHNEIVAYGLQFAGIASRDEVLQLLNRAQLPR